MKHIYKELSNHVTDTDKKMDEIKAGQKELKAEQRENYKELRTE